MKDILVNVSEIYETLEKAYWYTNATSVYEKHRIEKGDNEYLSVDDLFNLIVNLVTELDIYTGN